MERDENRLPLRKLRAALDSHRYHDGRLHIRLLGLPESNSLIDHFDDLKEHSQKLPHCTGNLLYLTTARSRQAGYTL